MSRDRVERAVLAVLRPVVIIGFLIATLLPFYTMLVLSLRPIEDLLRRPDSLVVDLSRLTLDTYVDVLRPVGSLSPGERTRADLALVFVGTDNFEVGRITLTGTRVASLSRGVPGGDDDGAGGLLGQLARLEGDLSSADLDGHPSRFRHMFLSCARSS